MGLDPELYLQTPTREEIAEMADTALGCSHKSVEDLVEDLESNEHGRVTAHAYTRGPFMAVRLG